MRQGAISTFKGVIVEGSQLIQEHPDEGATGDVEMAKEVEVQTRLGQWGVVVSHITSYIAWQTDNDHVCKKYMFQMILFEIFASPLQALRKPTTFTALVIQLARYLVGQHPDCQMSGDC